MVSILPLNNNQDDNKEDNQKSCQVCGRKCTNRCSRCQLVYYCQLECQRLDWNDGGHRKTCKGNQIRQRLQRKRRCKSHFGPSLPPPSIVRNESDAEHALKELRSIAVEALSTSSGEGPSSKTKTIKTASIISGQEEIKSKRTKSSLSTSVTTTTTKTASSARIESTTTATTCSTPKAIITTEKNSTNELLKHPKEKKKEKNSSSLSLTSSSSSNPQLSDDDEDENDDKNRVASSFVVEEMSQICTYQLTLKQKRSKQTLSFNEKYYDDEFNDEGSVLVTAKPIGQSGTSTLILISYDKKSTITTTSNQNILLFVGEFPCPIDASDITWRVIKSNDNDDDNDDDNNLDDSNSSAVIVFRLRYPYDPLDNNNISGDTYSSSSSTCSLRDINGVMCGSCYQPLLTKKSSNNNNRNCDNDNNGKDSLSSFSSSFVIHRVFPLPMGHWDEISDYLICYDGQPAVDFSAGAVCAEPSMALQDANCLCLHRNDVEMAICALAVDGYGEFTERHNDNDKDGINSDKNDDSKADLLSSSSFMLPKGVNYFEPSSSSSSSSSSTEGKENVKDSAFNPKSVEDSIGDKNSSSSSAAVRGDRIWQSATDGESVSLCCGRCCSPLGFTSLESPDTWRFWKHRLSIPLTENSEENKNDDINLLMYNSSPFLNRNNYTYMPLGSCSSFLARELVRYAESKAIFTFLVRCEHNNGMEESNKCLLLRLLSWETTMATSFKESSCLSQYNNSYNDSRRRKHRLNFRRVAKIVFEETIDPTAKNRHSTHNNDSTTQWFWGGVDLCCLPPPSNKDINTSGMKADSTSNDVDDATILKPASTVKLQLSQEEYDQVLSDLVYGRSYFTKEIAEATVMIKMGGLSKGLGLTAVVL